MSDLRARWRAWLLTRRERAVVRAAERTTWRAAMIREAVVHRATELREDRP